MSKRLFLAIRIPIDKEISSYLSEYQRQFGFAKMRWVEDKYLHLTLKFFGNINLKTSKEIQKSLGKVLKNTPKFTFSISKLSVFGSKNAPSVLWWGVLEEEFIKNLASNLQSEFDKIGLYADRQNFVPHITLARIIKTNSGNFFQKQLKRFSKLNPMEINVEKIVLLESKLTNKNPEYIQIAEYKLI